MADELYERKMMDMQKHIPFVERFVFKLKSNNNAERSIYLQKMEILYDILTNKDKKSSLETLQKCEAAILKLHSKIEKKPTSPVAEDVTVAQCSSSFKSSIEAHSHIVTPNDHTQDPSHSLFHKDKGCRKTSSHRDRLSGNDEKFNQKSQNITLSQNANRPSIQNTLTYSQERFPIISKVGNIQLSIPVEILNTSNSNFPKLPSSSDFSSSLNSPTMIANKLTKKLPPQKIVKKNDVKFHQIAKKLEDKQFKETKVKSEANSDQTTKTVVKRNLVENNHNKAKNLKETQMKTSGKDFEPGQPNEKSDISIYVKEEQSIEKNGYDRIKVLNEKKENSRKTESQVIQSKVVKHCLDMTEKSSEKLMCFPTKGKEIEERNFTNALLEIDKLNERKNESKIDHVHKKTAKIKNKNTRSKQIKTNNIQKVKDSITTEKISEKPHSASSETIENQESDIVGNAHSSPSPLNMTRRSTIDDSHVQVSSPSAVNGKIKEAANNKLESSQNGNVTKEWLNSFLLNLLNPVHINKTTVLEILEKVLDEEKFEQIKTIVNDEAEPQSPVRRRKGLDCPNEDNQDININESILTNKGRRMCMVVNEKQGEITTVSETTSNTSKSVPISRKSNLACKNKSMVTEKRQAVNEIPAKIQRNTTTQATAANIALQRDNSSEKVVVNREKEKNGMTMNAIVAPKKTDSGTDSSSTIKIAKRW